MSTAPDLNGVQTFMVVGTMRDDADLARFAELREDEHQQLDRLRQERRVGAHYVSPARRATFVEVFAPDEQGAAQTLSTLPFVQFFDIEIYPTAPADAAERAHRAQL
jgi:muconolactone delta-isomerase